VEVVEHPAARELALTAQEVERERVQAARMERRRASAEKRRKKAAAGPPNW
jgi:hypothetical protein